MRYSFLIAGFFVFTSAFMPLSCKDQWITIFVHGNMDLKPHIFSLENLRRFVWDQVEGSQYLAIVNQIRDNPFFYQHHAMLGLGLVPIDMGSIRAGYAAGAHAYAYNQLLSFAPRISGGNLSPEYYTFGWSGVQSPSFRLADARLFYQAIQSKIAELAKRGIAARIRVIGYSHGGNVALNVGAWYKPEDGVHIDELVLVGVPIIAESDVYVASPLFKRIINMYSMGDRVQPIDCLSVQRFFSGRVFKPRAGLVLPAHLYQVRVSIKRLARCGSSQLRAPVKIWKRSLERTADAGHIELWSFGWANGYRQHFPLYPLPLAAYSGYIVEHLLAHPELGNQVHVTLFPAAEKMFLKNTVHSVVIEKTFVPLENLTKINEHVFSFCPTMYTSKLFKSEVDRIIDQVHQRHHTCYSVQPFHKASKS